MSDTFTANLASGKTSGTYPAAPNPNVPAIAAPAPNLETLAGTVQAMKQGLESLAGVRGDPQQQAVTFADLDRLGVSYQFGGSTKGGTTATSGPTSGATHPSSGGRAGTVPTVPDASDSSTLAANTAFTQAAITARLVSLPSVDVSGGAVVVLTRAQAASPVILLQGALTADVAVVVPTALGRFLVANYTTGAFTLTVRTASGTGTAVAVSTTARDLWCDGINVWGTN